MIEQNKKFPRVIDSFEKRMKMYAELKQKQCAVCKEIKITTLFYKDKRRVFGVARECKQCKESETRKRRKLKPELFKAKRKRSFLKEKFKMTIDQWNKLFESQNERCAICEKHQSDHYRGLAVDHNHQTNQVRGLLCDNCNIGLGRFRDNENLLLKASEYLKKFKN